MNFADWVIMLVLLLSVIHAASSGFFQEAFAIAGRCSDISWRRGNTTEWPSHLSPYIKFTVAG